MFIAKEAPRLPKQEERHYLPGGSVGTSSSLKLVESIRTAKYGSSQGEALGA